MPSGFFHSKHKTRKLHLLYLFQHCLPCKALHKPQVSGWWVSSNVTLCYHVISDKHLATESTNTSWHEFYKTALFIDYNGYTLHKYGVKIHFNSYKLIYIFSKTTEIQLSYFNITDKLSFSNLLGISKQGLSEVCIWWHAMFTAVVTIQGTAIH
jgi:hypothetical protein